MRLESVTNSLYDETEKKKKQQNFEPELQTKGEVVLFEGKKHLIVWKTIWWGH